MVSDALLEELRHKGEGADLDYKSDRYPFSRATDEQKSEILKDILALANSHRSGTAYILMGFKECSPHPAEVVGLSSGECMDDSRLQEFVNQKLANKLIFKYEERIFEGKNIAVISIPKQKRPFYLKKDWGRLTKNTVYVRRGSSTDTAEPSEIAMMGSEDLAKGDPQVSLVLHDENNQPLPNTFEREFFIFPEELPDYEEHVPAGIISITPKFNRDYFRDLASYISISKRLIKVRLSLFNHSTFPLTGATLEVTCDFSKGGDVELMAGVDIPETPDSSEFAYLNNISLPRQGVEVNERGPHPVGQIILGAIRPGQHVYARDDLAILPSCAGRHVLKVKVLADEISSPMTIEHPFDVSGEERSLGVSYLYRVIGRREPTGRL